MLTQEAQGNHVEVTLLTVHSQDHLMTSIAFTDLAKEIRSVSSIERVIYSKEKREDLWINLLHLWRNILYL